MKDESTTLRTCWEFLHVTRGERCVPCGGQVAVYVCAKECKPLDAFTTRVCGVFYIPGENSVIAWCARTHVWTECDRGTCRQREGHAQ